MASAFIPDFGMIGGLRTHLADAGYTTLSVQMPVLSAGASRDDYAVALPAAGERIARGDRVPAREGHREDRHRLAQHGRDDGQRLPRAARACAIDAWVPIGMLVDFASPPKEPVQDVIAESELPAVAAAAPLRAKRLPSDACSRQVTIAGADHYFERRQKEPAAASLVSRSRFRRSC